MATNISLDQDAIQAIAAALKDTIQSNIEVMLQSSIQTIVEGVIFGLQSKVSKLEEENSNLKSSNEVLTKRVRDLELRSDAAEQYSKRNCLRISGLPESDSENTDDLVLGVCEALQTNINVADIDRSHCLGRPKQKSPRDILVKFATYRARQKLYTKRTSLKDIGDKFKCIYVNEQLTSVRSNLLFEARSLVKAGNLLGAWSSDGNILIKAKHDDGTPTLRIVSPQDLEPYR